MKKQKYGDLSRFFSLLLKEKIIFFRGWLVFILWGINGVAHVLFLEKITYSLDTGNEGLFFNIMKIYFLYLLLYEIFFWLTAKIGWTLIYNTAMKIIQKSYMSHFIRIDNNYYESVGVGKGVSIINKGMTTWAKLIDSFIENSSYILTSLILTLYMLGKVSVIYTILFLCLYILFIYISYQLNRYILKYRKMRIEYENIHTKSLVKILMTKNEVLQSDNINTELKKLDLYQNKEIFYNNKMAYFINGFYRIPSGSITLLLFLTFFYFGNQYFLGNIGLSLIVGLGGSLILMQRSIVFTVDYYKRFTQDFTDIKNFWDFFDDAPQIKGYEEGDIFVHKKGEINIEKLNFGYGENKNIFTDFSLKINGEKVLALVGDSGSGKSTLAKMIAGYMRPNEGEIVVDNQKLSQTSLKSYYKDIGYLTQDPSVFDGSILENLTYALEEKVSEEKLKEIIIQAKCEFIYDLPNGVETQIGERGVKLSGGQKQRLAIAKIFLKDPKIIILDEPTSALDSFSEEQITKAMQNLFKNRTVVVIAHRLQTVKHADRIIVLEQGKLIEDGTHHELVRKQGKYAKMLELQSGF